MKCWFARLCLLSWVPPLGAPGHLLDPMFPCVVPTCLAGAPNQVSDDEAPIPSLHVTPPPLGILPVLPLPRLLTVMMKFPFRASHTVLLWFHVVVHLLRLSVSRL
jgi:hypothetical protein